MYRSLGLPTLAFLLTLESLPGETGSQTPLDDLKSDDAARRNQAVASFLADRQTTVAYLIQMMKGNYSDEVRLAAVKLLGSYRAEEAAQVLVDNIQLGFVGGTTGLRTDEQIMPVVHSLRQIGQPCVPVLLKRIATTEDRSCSGLCIYSLYRIVGYHEGRRLLQKAIDAEKAEDRKARLKVALELLTNEDE